MLLMKIIIRASVQNFGGKSPLNSCVGFLHRKTSTVCVMDALSSVYQGYLVSNSPKTTASPLRPNEEES